MKTELRERRARPSGSARSRRAPTWARTARSTASEGLKKLHEVAAFTPDYDFNFVRDGRRDFGQEEPEPLTHRELFGERGAEIGRALGNQAAGRYIGEAIGSAVNATVGPVDPNDVDRR